MTAEGVRINRPGLSDQTVDADPCSDIFTISGNGMIMIVAIRTNNFV
jgi:hypothetical protein